MHINNLESTLDAWDAHIDSRAPRAREQNVTPPNLAETLQRSRSTFPTDAAPTPDRNRSVSAAPWHQMRAKKAQGVTVVREDIEMLKPRSEGSGSSRGSRSNTTAAQPPATRRSSERSRRSSERSRSQRIQQRSSSRPIPRQQTESGV